jgi:hypothetical protein
MIELPSPVIVRQTPGAVTYRGGVLVLGDAILQLPGRTFTADQLDEAKEVAAALLAGIARLEARQ